MADIDYLFIFMTPGCDPAAHRSVMDTPEGDAITVGVSDLDQACEVAAAAAVDGKLPVGYVTYFPEEQMRVDALFA